MVETYAETGLRTLLLARRDISAAEYEQFAHQIETIQDTRRGMDDLDELIDQVYTEIEQDLILVGATAIEDCLQDKCKTTI
jgi:magnesium-transporting ATPase (P-type)